MEKCNRFGPSHLIDIKSWPEVFQRAGEAQGISNNEWKSTVLIILKKCIYPTEEILDTTMVPKFLSSLFSQNQNSKLHVVLSSSPETKNSFTNVTSKSVGQWSQGSYGLFRTYVIWNTGHVTFANMSFVWFGDLIDLGANLE